MNARFAVVSLWAEDVPTTAHFSHEVLGLHFLPHHGAHPAFDLDGAYLTNLKGKPRPAQDAEPVNVPLFARAVDDLDAALALLQAHRVDLPWGIDRGAQSRWVKFYDAAGNLIELVEFDE